MEPERLVQNGTCRLCGMPYGNPDPQVSSSRSYCERCSNLPEDIMALLEQQCKQLAQKAQEVKDPTAPGPMPR